MTTKRGILKPSSDFTSKKLRIDTTEEEFKDKLNNWIRKIIVDFGKKIREKQIVDYKLMTSEPEEFENVELRIAHDVNKDLLLHIEYDLDIVIENHSEILTMLHTAITEYVVLEKVKIDGKQTAMTRLKSHAVPDRIGDAMYSAQCHLVNEWVSKISYAILLPLRAQRS